MDLLVCAYLYIGIMLRIYYMYDYTEQGIVLSVVELILVGFFGALVWPITLFHKTMKSD